MNEQAEIIELRYEIARTQFFLDELIAQLATHKIPIKIDVESINEKAIALVQDKYPEHGITRACKTNSVP